MIARTLGYLLAVVLLAAAHAASAQPYPVKPIRFVVPFPPGGVTDRMARLVSQRMQERWGQPVVVENRPGGSGFIASQAVANSAPDGYTLLMGNINTHGINPSLFAKMPYDPVKDFAPVSLLVAVPNLLLLHPSVPASNVAELIALARANPGTINFASPGTGTSGHMSAELLKSMAGIDIVHIPYKGPGPALQDLLAGQVNMLFDTVASSLPQVRGGKLKGLAVTSPARLALASDIPAVAETLPGFEIAPWFGVLARAGTPPATVAKLQAEMARILALPDVRENLVGAQGMTIIASTPEAFAAYIDEEIARWAKVVKTIGVRPE